MSADTYTEVMGVQWCIAHQGICDETSDNDDRCDMAGDETDCLKCDGEGVDDLGSTNGTTEDCPACDGFGVIVRACQIVPVYVKGDKS